MRLTLVALAFLFGMSMPARAQEVTLTDVSARSFSGVRSINGQYYYTICYGEKTENKGMANFVLSLFDKDLKAINTTKLEVSKNSELAGSAFTGKYFLFIFADINRKTRSLFVLDASGNVKQQKVEEDVRRALLIPENYPDVHVISEEEFLLVRPEKEKKFGYEVERLSADLQSKWQKEFYPEKGVWFLEDSKMANARLYLLRQEKPNGRYARFFTSSIQAINLENGDVAYTTPLVNDNVYGFPSFIQSAPNGQVVTGGVYFDKGQYNEKTSDGFFFSILDQEGKTKNTTSMTWKQIQDQYRDDALFELFNGKTRVLAEDVLVKKDGTFMLIGETFRKSRSASSTGSAETNLLRTAGSLSGNSMFSGSGGNSNDRGFTVLDFMFFQFDAQGKLTAVQKVSKAAREAAISGRIGDESDLALARILQKRRFFCYQQVVENAGKQYVMFKNEDGYKTKAYFMPVDGTTTQGLASIDMDKWVSDGVNSLGKLSSLTGGNKRTISDQDGPYGNDPELFRNAIPAKEGHVLLYHYFNGKLKIWLEPIPIK